MCDIGSSRPFFWLVLPFFHGHRQCSSVLLECRVCLVWCRAANFPLWGRDRCQRLAVHIVGDTRLPSMDSTCWPSPCGPYWMRHLLQTTAGPFSLSRFLRFLWSTLPKAAPPTLAPLLRMGWRPRLLCFVFRTAFPGFWLFSLSGHRLRLLTLMLAPACSPVPPLKLLHCSVGVRSRASAHLLPASIRRGVLLLGSTRVAWAGPLPPMRPSSLLRTAPSIRAMARRRGLWSSVMSGLMGACLISFWGVQGVPSLSSSAGPQRIWRRSWACYGHPFLRLASPFMVRFFSERITLPPYVELRVWRTCGRMSCVLRPIAFILRSGPASVAGASISTCSVMRGTLLMNWLTALLAFAAPV